jgi:hypothetical protein
LLRYQIEIFQLEFNGRISPRLNMVAALNMKAAAMETIDSVTELNPQGT